MRLNEPMPLPRICDLRTIQRFMSFVELRGSAWHWTGAKDRKGYGRFYYEGHMIAAHRVAYAIFRGNIEEGLVVHHTSPEGGSSNVNPWNLEAISPMENTVIANYRKSTQFDIPI